MLHTLPIEMLSRLSPTFVQIGSRTFPDGLTHEKTVPFAIIAMPTRGRYEITCDGETIIAGTGEAFMTRPGRPMRIVHHAPRGGEMASHWLHLGVTLDSTTEAMSLLDCPLKLPRSQTREPHRIASQMAKLLQGAYSPAAVARWQRLVWELVDWAFTTFLIRTKPSPEPAALTPVIAHLRSRLAFPVTVAEMAAIAGISESHLHHTFKRLTGHGPMEHLKVLRLNEAARRLVSTDQSVGDIALDVGFANAFHFSREFKRKFDAPPSAYRAIHRQR